MKKAGLLAVIVLASVFVFGTSVIAGDSKPAPAPAKPAPPAQRSAPAPAPAPKLAPAPAPAPTGNYNVNTGNTTLRSQGGLNPAPQPVRPVTTMSPAPSTPPAQTKVIMAPTWPVQVPVRVPANTPERPDNPHAGENVGAAQGLGGR
jgi:Meckel syndrome type 1 protein